MILPDVNLLVYAYNAADPQHKAARIWWERCLNGSRPVGLPWVVAAGFIRLMTHPRVLREPMATAAAVDHVRSWLDQPCVLVMEPGKRFPDRFLSFLTDLGTAANLTTDAYLAALAIEHQAELHSCDTDFFRFEGLRWRNPLAPSRK
ncbi:MAG: type II toxin-antitoxin system VapC family toxin [Opitutales bacterium]|nr:type II toxin-antitoxin system VapC family toxin [Opitutales bacterium]